MKTGKQHQLEQLQDELAYYQTYEEEPLHYGQTIQRYREVAGYSRETLAEALNMATRTLENIENERNRPSLELLHELSLLLDFSITIQKGHVWFGHSTHQSESIRGYFQRKVETELHRWSKKPLPLLTLLTNLDQFSFARFHEYLGYPFFECPISWESFQTLTMSSLKNHEETLVCLPCCRFEVFLDDYQFDLVLHFQIKDPELWLSWTQSILQEVMSLKKESWTETQFQSAWQTACVHQIDTLSTIVVNQVTCTFENERRLNTFYI